MSPVLKIKLFSIFLTWASPWFCELGLATLTPFETELLNNRSLEKNDRLFLLKIQWKIVYKILLSV